MHDLRKHRKVWGNTTCSMWDKGEGECNRTCNYVMNGVLLGYAQCKGNGCRD